MRDYEVVYIFRADLEAEEVDERLEAYHDRLGDGEVTAVEHWGQRKLAYEIKDRRKGYYVVVQFRTEPESLTDFEQGLKHDEGLLRHLVVLSEGELPTPPSQRGEDEEEEEPDEEEDEESEAEDEPSAEEEAEAGDEEDAEEEEEAGDEEEEPGDEEDEEAAADEDEEADEADEAEDVDEAGDASEDEPSDDAEEEK